MPVMGGCDGGDRVCMVCDMCGSQFFFDGGGERHPTASRADRSTGVAPPDRCVPHSHIIPPSRFGAGVLLLRNALRCSARVVPGLFVIDGGRGVTFRRYALVEEDVIACWGSK